MIAEEYAVKAGELVEFEDGEYSDHSVWSPMRALKDFNVAELAKEYLSSRPEEKQKANFYAFVGWLSANGYIEENTLGVNRIWLGSFEEWNKELSETPEETASKYSEGGWYYPSPLVERKTQ